MMQQGRSSMWKWWITGLLLLATTINYMDRVALGNVASRVTSELHLSKADYGHLETVFGLSFAAGSLLFGFLADRWRVYWLYPAVLALWSLVGMLTGWSQGFGQLLICRGLLGFFEAGHWPCALKTTFALLSERDRTMGNSVLQSGASIGAIITPQIMLLLLTPEPGSWRAAFIMVGLPGLLWVVLWFMSLRPSDLDGATRGVVDARVVKANLWRILLSRRFAAVGLLILGTQTVWHIYRAWLTLFLQGGRGYDEVSALHFSSLYFLATDVGCIAAGLLSLRLVRGGRFTAHRARRWVYAAACVMTSTAVLIPSLGKGWPLLASLLVIGAGALALFPCYYSFVQELSTEFVGRLTGILSALVWAVTSPLHSLFGWVADRSSSYDLGLVIAGLAPWIGVVAMAWLWGEDKVPAATARG
jgi:MFS transporter, ACS family, hexuronate transporter